jgi:hypothetical protein
VAGWIALVILVIGSIASGLLLGRWVALVIPAVVIPLFYIGLRYGWWGYGVGDSWRYVGAAITILTIVATGGAVVLSRSVRQ